MAVALTVGGTAATEVTVVSDTELTARAPRGTGVVDVAVTTLGGTATADDVFTYTPPALGLTFVTTTANQAVTIGLSGCSADNVMDWGDGAAETLDTTNPTAGVARAHTYTDPGTYHAGYYGTLTRVGTLSTQLGAALVSVDNWSAASGVTNATGAFRGATGLTFVATPPPSIVLASSMFDGASALTGASLAGWVTSAITNATTMFRSAAAFNADISGWVTSAITNMSGMFQSATAFNQDLSGWDVDQVTIHTNFNTGANAAWVANAAYQPQWSA